MDLLVDRLGISYNKPSVKHKYSDLYTLSENYKLSTIELENAQLKDAINETISASQESETIVKKDRNLLQKTWDKFIEFVNKIIKFIKRVALKIRRFFYKSRLEKIDYFLSKNKKPKYVTKIYSEKKMSHYDLTELSETLFFGDNVPEDRQPRMVFSTLRYETPIGSETHYLRSLISSLENGSYNFDLLKLEDLESSVTINITETSDRIHKIFPDFMKRITEDKLKPEDISGETIDAFNSNIRSLYKEVSNVIQKDDKDSIHHIYNRYLNVLEKIKTEKVNDVTPEYIDYMTKLVKDIQIRVQWVHDDIDKFLSVIEDIYGLK